MAHVKHPVVQGARYHSLVIKKEAPSIHVGKYAVRMVSCACDCGKEIIVARGWSNYDAVTKPRDKRGRRHA